MHQQLTSLHPVLIVVCSLAHCSITDAQEKSEQESKRSDSTNILLVVEQEESKQQSIESGSVFLERVYKASQRGNERIRSTKTTLDKLRESIDGKPDVIVMYGISKMDRQQRLLLKKYYQSGGSLIWFLHPNADKRFYESLSDEMADPMLPASLVQLKTFDEKDSPTVADCSLVDRSVFRGEFAIGKIWQIDQNRTQEKSVNALVLSDGSPAVVVNQRLRTAVFLLSTHGEDCTWFRQVSWVVFQLKLIDELLADSQESKTGRHVE